MRHDQTCRLVRSGVRQRVRPRPVCEPREGRVRAAMDESLVPDYALEALQVLIDAGKQAFVVGGFVRDVLRGAPAHDVDMTTDALWYQARDIFIERGYRVVETGARHGTVTVFVGTRPVEITTFRTDGVYRDHRRPDSVRFVRDVEDDLARRDFTVNAMAWSPTVGLVDPFGGRSDLENGIVRAVGDAAVRFEEDALRIMRGVRFSSKLDFAVEEATAQAIHDHVADLSHVARERIAAEYDGIVQGPGSVRVLRAYPDVAACAVPAIASMVGFDQHSKWHCYDVWEHCLHALELVDEHASALVRHTVLLHDVGKPTTFSIGSDGRGHFYGHEEQGARILRSSLDNLRWRKADIDRACCLVRLHDHRIEATPRGVRRMLARIGSSFPGAQGSAVQLMHDLIAVKRADALAHAPSCVERRLRELDAAHHALEETLANDTVFCLRDLALDGDDVISCGVEPGPDVGRALRRLLALVIDGRVDNEPQALLDALIHDSSIFVRR